MNDKDFVVFSIDIAHELMALGYHLNRVAKNKNFPLFNVYYFENEDDIEEMVEHLKKRL